MSLLTDRLYQTSFKGTPFYFRAESRVDGRRMITQEIYNREDIVEDAGKNTRVFNVTGIVKGLLFKEDAKNLEDKLNSIGSGIFVHPELGSIVCFCMGFTRSLDLNNLGVIEYSIVFKEDLQTTYPLPSSNVVNKIANLYDKFYSFASQNIAINYLIQGLKTVDRIAQKMRELADQVGIISSAIAGIADIGSEFTSQIKDFTSKAYINSLSPNAMSTSLPGLLGSFDSLSDDGQERFDINDKLFGFGSSDSFLNLNTTDLTQRNKNLKLINSTINALALVNSYDSSTLIPYSNDEQIDLMQSNLNAKFESFISSKSVAVSDEMMSRLDEIRVLAKTFFDQERLNVSKVVEIKAAEQPLTILTYRYYGSTDNFNDLLSLNGIYRPERVSGTLKVLERD